MTFRFQQDYPDLCTIEEFRTYEFIVSTLQAMEYCGMNYMAGDIPTAQKAEYTKELYVNQLHELLGALNITEPVHIAGISMGGAVAVFFAETWLHRVASIILPDPVGPCFVKNSNSKVLARIGGRIWEKLTANSKETNADKHMSELRKRMKEQRQYKGVGRLLLSSFRNRSYDEILQAYRY